MRTEAELVQDCLKGNRAAERELFERYAGRMAALCRRYTNSPDDAQDLLQEGFIRVYAKLNTWQGGSLEGWMRKIFIHNCLNAYQSRQRRLALIEHQTEAQDDVALHEGFYDFLATEALLAAINSLPEGARVIFNLFAIEGYAHTEIAQMLNLSEGACRSQLTRARKLLQDRLGLKNLASPTTHQP